MSDGPYQRLWFLSCVDCGQLFFSIKNFVEECDPLRVSELQKLALCRSPQGCLLQSRAVFPGGNRQGQRDRSPSLPEIPLRTIPRRADRRRHAGTHAPVCGQIRSPQASLNSNRVRNRTPGSITHQIRSRKMRMSERLPKMWMPDRLRLC